MSRQGSPTGSLALSPPLSVSSLTHLFGQSQDRPGLYDDHLLLIGQILHPEQNTRIVSEVPSGVAELGAGCSVGLGAGCSVGLDAGCSVGQGDRCSVGLGDGCSVGLGDGCSVGLGEGWGRWDRRGGPGVTAKGRFH